jgi:TonB family protein
MKAPIKIVKVRPVVSEEEIRRSMDFDSVVRLFNVRSIWMSNWTRGLFVTGGGIIVMSTVYVLTSNNAQPVESSKQNMTIIAADSSVVTPVVETSTNINAERVEQKQPEGSKRAVGVADSLAKATEQEIVNELPKKNDESKPSFDYVEAEPVEGYPHLYAYFASDLHYPEEAVRDSTQGTLSVSFIINGSGKPEKIAIENSLGPLFDQETIRLIENMPAWKSATFNGKPVPSRISLPLTFRIIKVPPARKK